MCKHGFSLLEQVEYLPVVRPPQTKCDDPKSFAEKVHFLF